MFDVPAFLFVFLLLFAIFPLSESLVSTQQQQRRSIAPCISKDKVEVHTSVSFAKTTKLRLPSLLFAEQEQNTSSSSKGGNQKEKKASSSNENEKAKKESSTHRSVAIFAYMESMKSSRTATFAIRKMENDPNYLKLDRRDRAFARRILSTAERRQGQIEKVINNFRKTKNKDPSSPSKSQVNHKHQESFVFV